MSGFESTAQVLGGLKQSLERLVADIVDLDNRDTAALYAVTIQEIERLIAEHEEGDELETIEEEVSVNEMGQVADVFDSLIGAIEAINERLTNLENETDN